MSDGAAAQVVAVCQCTSEVATRALQLAEGGVERAINYVLNGDPRLHVPEASRRLIPA